ncbi:hypothetical protein NPIL_238321 [Nephila pilipes]|uniref:Uncharacterized protein n=1 Tax=Nephila pilipes TaxID=299642 RepID=A0A8X6PVI2_NEPPI|nr:hypothetical protein NPIL_238321 [Nephila pilipes]
MQSRNISPVTKIGLHFLLSIFSFSDKISTKHVCIANRRRISFEISTLQDIFHVLLKVKSKKKEISTI